MITITEYEHDSLGRGQFSISADLTFATINGKAYDIDTEVLRARMRDELFYIMTQQAFIKCLAGKGHIQLGTMVAIEHGAPGGPAFTLVPLVEMRHAGRHLQVFQKVETFYLWKLDERPWWTKPDLLFPQELRLKSA